MNGRAKNAEGITGDRPRVRLESTLHKDRAPRVLVENLQQVVYHAHPSTYAMLYVNRAAENLLGYSRTEWLSDPHFFQKMIHPDERDRVMRDVMKAKSDCRNIEIQYRLRRKNGQFIWVEDHVGWEKEGDKAVAVVGVLYDITERKTAEKEREELLRALDLKNRELHSVVYTASHDLKSPLVNIEGFSGELGKCCTQLAECLKRTVQDGRTKRQIEALIEEEIPECLHFISAGTMKMKQLLDGLLRISRVGSVELEKEKLDMNGLVEAIMATMHFQIEQRCVSVEMDDLPPCFGDAGQMDHVFSNLLDNALKYLDPKKQGVIRVSGCTEGKLVTYCVEDNGVGIEKGHQERVFQIFHRLYPDGPVSGDGLGLTIAARILDRHNGRIRLESEPGRGSRFYVTLPGVCADP